MSLEFKVGLKSKNNIVKLLGVKITVVIQV